MGAFQDLSGLRFGRLVVIAAAGRNAHHKRLYSCLCDCGKLCTVIGGNMNSGGTKSCGCATVDRFRERLTKHGLASHKYYPKYKSMLDRCYNDKCAEYENYGGRGIVVCDEWRSDPASYFRDIGDAPSPTHSIDRIDNDGHYCKENVRWATKQQQNLNRRTARMISFNGFSKNEMEWCSDLGMKKGSISCRLKKGWSLEAALTTPKIPKGHYIRKWLL